MRNPLASSLVAVADVLDSTATRLKRRSDRRRRATNVTLSDLTARGFSGVAPVFVLSTGRTGTALFSDLLESTGQAAVHHSPRPELVRVSRRAFEEGADKTDMFDEIALTAREELVTEAVRNGRAYVETNNRVTFFAPSFARVFPESRFIHIVRHPADIVRSGIRRGWYEGEHAHDMGRIRPLDAAQTGWFDRDPIEKIGWLWQQTNQFCEEFLATIDESRIQRTTAERLFSDAAEVERLISFCGVTPPPRQMIEARIARPVNQQTGGSFPRYHDWTNAQRALLRDACPLASHYGYEI